MKSTVNPLSLKYTSKEVLELVRTLFEAEQQDRERIYNSLHYKKSDLALLKLYTQKHIFSLEKGVLQESEFNGDKEVIDNLFSDLRILSQEIFPKGVNEAGSTKSFENYVNQLVKVNKANIKLEISNDEIFVEKSKEISLYKVLTGLLDYLIPESEKITIKLAMKNTVMTFEYTKQGKTVPAMDSYLKKLEIVKARLILLGARVSANTDWSSYVKFSLGQ